MSKYSESLKILVWSRKEQFSDMVQEVYTDNNRLIVSLTEYENKIKYFSDRIKKDEKLSNKLKGDMFETFAALFFKQKENDERVGLNNYEPIPPEDDYGVDGIGRNAAGTSVVVQVKYKENPLSLIEYEDLSKTFSYGVIRGWIKPDEKHSLYLFTNAAGTTIPCKNVFGHRLVVLNREILCTLLNGNKNFWANFILNLSLILGEEV